MPIERVVINASPLIILFRAHLESLLPGLFRNICIPEAVWSEITRSDYKDESVSGIINAEWAKKVNVDAISPNITAWDLGAGESEVLDFTLQHPEFCAMVDDKVSRMKQKDDRKKKHRPPRDVLPVSFKAFSAELSQLISPGILGHYKQCEVTEIVGSEPTKGPVNFLSIIVFEENSLPTKEPQ